MARYDDPSSPRPGRGERARVRGTESPLIDRLEMPALGSGVDGGRPDDLIVDALLHHVRRPASRARYDEYRREHWRGNAHLVVRHGGKPVEVREHLALAHHYRLDALRDVVHLHV